MEQDRNLGTAHCGQHRGQLNGISWTADFRDRVNPRLMTKLLRRAVPVLDYADWTIEEVGDGYTRSLLPLSAQSTNQHGTHQAAVMALAADYTGGLALATVLRGAPIAGVHPVTTSDAMLLWLARLEIGYKIPSSDDLHITCTVPADRVAGIRDRYHRGRRALVRLAVEFSNGRRTVASGHLTYFLQRARAIRPRANAARPGGLFVHKLNSSARMIAGVRAREAASRRPLIYDPYSAAVAGKHGAFLAESFCRKLPLLQPMVAARTKNADMCLKGWLGRGRQQVVLLGSGLDCRPFRMANPETVFFELDFPEMLKEREAMLREIPCLPPVRRIPVPGNIELDDIGELLRNAPEFDTSKPTFHILEGVSMYFEPGMATGILEKLRELLVHTDDRLWTDVVSEEVVDGSSAHADVRAFVDGMAELGEPFLFGTDDAAGLLASLDFRTLQLVSSGLYHPNPNPVLDLYHFALLGRM